MLIDEVVTELLLRWEDKPSLTPEELCCEYTGRPEYPALLEAVQRGLRHLQAAASFGDTSPECSSGSQRMPTPTEGPAAPQEAPAAWTASGLRYRPVSFHAQGGLGEVFRAEDEELHREVALKRIQERHRDNAESHRRFLQEAEITAKLQHPGIVPVYGLASDEDGQPCYAMRFIEGGTLDDAIKRFHEAEQQPGRDPGERSLALRELLSRFIAVCNTMAYAHSRGIVHRDIKPGNIMLGDYGETLVVDWGLAKPFARTEAERVGGEETLMPAASGSSEGATQLGQVLGTPGYMSPEQADGRWDVVGRASDIFSLGATLYAVLAGHAPYQGRNAVETLSKARRGDFSPPREVKKDVPGVLEAICRKAMAFQPEQRYGTAKELAADVEQWLADQPVTAYREPLSARLWRWTRRHKTGMAVAAAMVLTTLLVGMAGLAVGIMAVRAEERRTQTALDQVTAEQGKTQAALEDAKAVLGFFQDKVLSAGRPEGQEGGQGIDVKLREAVDQAEPKIAEDFKDRPLVEASIRDTLGTTYLYLGKPFLAIQQHEGALALRQANLGADHPDTLSSINSLAEAFAEAGQLDKALPLYEQVLAKRKATLGADHPDTLTSKNGLAVSYRDQGKYDLAEPLLKEVLQARTTKLGPDHPDTLISMNNLAEAYRDAGQLAKALQLHEQTLAIRKAKLGADHPNTLVSMDNLAGVYEDLGQWDKALPLYEQTLAKTKAKLGADHPDTLKSMNNLAGVYKRAGQFDKAFLLHQQTLAIRKAKLGDDHPSTLVSMNNLAEAYSDLGQLEKALPLYEQTLAMTKAKHGADHPGTVICMNNLAWAYKESGQLDKAIPLYEQTLAKWKAKLGTDHPSTLIGMNNLARAYQAASQLDRALPLFEETLAKRKAKLGADHPDTLSSMHNLAGAYADAGRSEKALSLYEQTLVMTKAKLGPDHPHTVSTIAALSLNLLRQKKYTDAEPILRECLGIRDKKQPDRWTTFDTRSMLGEALAGQKKYAEAEPLLLRGYEGLKQREKSIPAPSKVRLREGLERLVQLYDAWGKKDQADIWRKKLEETKKPTAKDAAKK